MRGMTLCETAAVYGDGFLLPVDADDQIFRQRCESGNGCEHLAVPMIGRVGRKVSRFARWRREPFQRFGYPAEGFAVVGHFPTITYCHSRESGNPWSEAKV